MIPGLGWSSGAGGQQEIEAAVVVVVVGGVAKARERDGQGRHSKPAWRNGQIQSARWQRQVGQLR